MLHALACGRLDEGEVLVACEGEHLVLYDLFRVQILSFL